MQSCAHDIFFTKSFKKNYVLYCYTTFLSIIRFYKYKAIKEVQIKVIIYSVG